MARLCLLTFLLAACVTAGCGRPTIAIPELRSPDPALTLVAQFSIPPQQRFPPIVGLPLGGISGLAARDDAPDDLFGISDAQHGGRIYRFKVSRRQPFEVAVDDMTVLSAPEIDRSADFEGVALLANGDFLVAAEGTGRVPRKPPSIYRFGMHGEFLGSLPVRERFVPDPTGPATRGARGNAGFESLALSPDQKTLFTAVETALVQDGEPANFERGTRTRLLEYREGNGTFKPAREFVYELDALPRPASQPGFSINGLVELLVLDRTTLLSLERGYVESAANAGTGNNFIRVYRISLEGATDVSPLDSIKDRNEIVPVRKTLLLDLAKAQGLDPALVPALDNFEGMAFGSPLPDGRRTLILVSDDNFSARQRTWFLEFAIGSVGSVAEQPSR